MIMLMSVSVVGSHPLDDEKQQLKHSLESLTVRLKDQQLRDAETHLKFSWSFKKRSQ